MIEFVFHRQDCYTNSADMRTTASTKSTQVFGDGHGSCSYLAWSPPVQHPQCALPHVPPVTTGLAPPLRAATPTPVIVGPASPVRAIVPGLPSSLMPSPPSVAASDSMVRQTPPPSNGFHSSCSLSEPIHFQLPQSLTFTSHLHLHRNTYHPGGVCLFIV
jgi:hypothetical protein